MEKLNKYGKCPECNFDWDGGDIPKKDREHYSPPYKWSKLIGIEVRDKYDGISYWMCPKCNNQWDRWTGKKILKTRI